GCRKLSRRVAPALGQGQRAQEIDACRLVEGIDVDEPAGETERSFRFRIMSAPQLGQQLDVETSQLFTLREAPRLEFVTVGQIQPFHELAAKGARRRQQLFRGLALQPLRATST